MRADQVIRGDSKNAGNEGFERGLRGTAAGRRYPEHCNELEEQDGYLLNRTRAEHRAEFRPFANTRIRLITSVYQELTPSRTIIAICLPVIDQPSPHVC